MTNELIYLRNALCALLVAGMVSCSKKESIRTDLYEKGESALGIKFSDALPVPAQGAPGSETVYKVRGLLPFKDRIKCFMNEEAAAVVAVTDSTIRLKVPETASSGGTTIQVDGQVFFGPSFVVKGRVSVDATFKTQVGTNGLILDVFKMVTGNWLLLGGFTDFDKKAASAPVNNIVMVSADGEYQSSLMAGKGPNGSLSSIVPLNNGQYLVAGTFNSYNGRKGINGLTRINSNGSLDTMQVEVVNLTPENPANNYDTVAAFNGGLVGSVNKVFLDKDKIIAIGNFSGYSTYFYERSTRDTKRSEFVSIPQVARLNMDGTLDSSYNYNLAAHKGNEGFNGAIYDAFQQPWDGKIVIAGSFTKLNGQSVGNIVRLNTDGTIDPGFTASADDAVARITYNAATKQYILTGSFTRYNTVGASGLVMVDRNGVINPGFVLAPFTGGGVIHAQQLTSGLVVVTGTFKKYNNVTRSGFMILNPDGTLAAGYNNTGSFNGIVMDITEASNALGQPTILLTGIINRFDNKEVGNIVRVVLNNN